jgi:hypothetical protein
MCVQYFFHRKVKLQSFKDVRQHETPENMWMFVTQRPKDLNVTVKACQWTRFKVIDVHNIFWDIFALLFCFK